MFKNESSIKKILIMYSMFDSYIKCGYIEHRNEENKKQILNFVKHIDNIINLFSDEKKEFINNVIVLEKTYKQLPYSQATFYRIKKTVLSELSDVLFDINIPNIN